MNRLLFRWRSLAIPVSIVLFTVWNAAHDGRGHASESRAHVRLVRLLVDVPDSERTTLGNVHDLKLRLERGNILLLRRGGASAAMMPIEAAAGARDSLRYFYYIEHSPFLWVFPGQKDKGIGTVGDGGTISISGFSLLWRADGELGWIYFPESPGNRNVRFSVVSGGTVDEADPMSTKYWIELAPTEGSGF